MVIGFNSLKEQIALENIKFIGCKENANGVQGNIDMTIKNSSSVSVLVDELPVEFCYKGIKVTYSGRLSFGITANTESDRGIYRAWGQHYISFIVK